jgi:Protein of unknown function (DUF3253)
MTESTGAGDSHIESILLELVQQRGRHATACPSEVARALAPTDWRALMPQVRSVASRLARQGKIEIAQGGKAVSADGPWKGPIRLRLPRQGPFA